MTLNSRSLFIILLSTHPAASSQGGVKCVEGNGSVGGVESVGKVESVGGVEED